MIKFCCQTLGKEDRKAIVEENKRIIEDLEIVQSVNGFNKLETMSELKKSGLRLVSLDGGFKNYGTLATFLTKFKCFKMQIENKIEYMCILEDDVLVKNNFEQYVKNLLIRFKDKDLNMIRLGSWGEGYITNLQGAARIVAAMYKTGIIRNVDYQLREFCGKEITTFLHTPWTIKIRGGHGDIKKTERIPFLKSYRMPMVFM